MPGTGTDNPDETVPAATGGDGLVGVPGNPPAAPPATPPAGEPPAGETLVAVGRIGKAHGLRGEVGVEAWTDDPEERFAPGVVLSTAREGVRTTPGAPLRVISSRQHAGRWLVAFEGVFDRTGAEALRGTRLLLPASARPVIDDPDEFYDTDLVGLVARTEDGTVLGTVSDVVHGPAGDYLVVDVPVDGSTREQLVPFVSQIVPTVDLAGGEVVIDAPDGLFEL